MKLTTFHAADGDCLLLTSGDGHHALVDGGRTGTFIRDAWPRMQELATGQEALDLVVVSHVDSDHIAGVRWLLDAVADWVVFDHQTGPGGNPNLPPPDVDRPPPIGKIWHNAWTELLADLAEPIESLAVRVGQARAEGVTGSTSDAALRAFELLDDLQLSIPDGAELRRTIADTGIVRNAPFKNMVLLRGTPHVEPLGSASLTVIGPTRKHIERFREDWRKWVETLGGGGRGEGRAVRPDSSEASTLAAAVQASSSEGIIASVAAGAEILHEADPSSVTPANRASITLLADEGGRTCLLTGDAAQDELLDGLAAAGRLADGPMMCNVLKVQHHGSEFNLDRRFAEKVLAENYVFCADGNHENPNPSVVKTIVETRLELDPRPFSIWFNCSPARTKPARRKALAAAIKEARRAEDRAGSEVHVLDDDKSSFVIEV